jgi:hypothetical protein
LPPVLLDRYARIGNPADLEDAVTAEIRAVHLTPTRLPQLPSRLNDLANALHARYDSSGSSADLL